MWPSSERRNLALSASDIPCICWRISCFKRSYSALTPSISRCTPYTHTHTHTHTHTLSKTCRHTCHRLTGFSGRVQRDRFFFSSLFILSFGMPLRSFIFYFQPWRIEKWTLDGLLKLHLAKILCFYLCSVLLWLESKRPLLFSVSFVFFQLMTSSTHFVTDCSKLNRVVHPLYCIFLNIVYFLS